MLVLVSTVMYPQAEVYFYTDSHTNVKLSITIALLEVCLLSFHIIQYWNSLPKKALGYIRRLFP